MALYQKYRPQSFATVIDQEHIITTITNQVSLDKLAHAYLFSGPRGTGKTTTARLLAKSANCQNRKTGEFEPCNDCSSCREIGNSNSIDVIEIDAASHTGVDNVRENIIENTQFKPTHSKYKIFIIDEVHMLSTASFNALLKTLEEPPSYVIFILATTELHKIPATIISRCLRFTFHKVTSVDLKKHLIQISKKENVDIDEEVIEHIVKKSDGAVRDAVGLLDQIIASGDKKITLSSTSFLLPSVSTELQIKLVASLVEKNAQNGLKLVSEVIDDGLPIGHIFSDLIEHLRSVLIYQADPELAMNEIDLSGKLLENFKQNANAIAPRELINLIDLTIQRSQQIKYSPLPQLPLEMLFIEWSSKSVSTVPLEPAKSDPVTAIKEKSTIVEAKKNNEVVPEKEKILEIKTQITPSPIETRTELNENDCKSVTKDDIINIWSKFISIVESKFPSLVFLLKMATIEKVDSDNTLTIAVPYSFHQEKLSERTCLNNMVELLNKILDAKMKLMVVTQKKDELANNLEINDIAAAFGGQVIA